MLHVPTLPCCNAASPTTVPSPDLWPVWSDAVFNCSFFGSRHRSSDVRLVRRMVSLGTTELNEPFEPMACQRRTFFSPVRDLGSCTLSDTVVGSSSTFSGSLPVGMWVNFIAIVDEETHARRIDVPMSSNQHDTEDRLGAEVQYAIEDSLGVWRDDIGTLGHTPGDRVAEPDEQGPHSAEHVGAIYVLTKQFSALAAHASEIPENIEHRQCTKRPPTWIAISHEQSTYN